MMGVATFGQTHAEVSTVSIIMAHTLDRLETKIFNMKSFCTAREHVGAAVETVCVSNHSTNIVRPTFSLQISIMGKVRGFKKFTLLFLCCIK